MDTCHRSCRSQGGTSRPSINEFGIRQPIVVDADGVIIAGHTPWQAATKLGLDEGPVHIATDPSPERSACAFFVTIVPAQPSSATFWRKRMVISNPEGKVRCLTRPRCDLAADIDRSMHPASDSHSAFTSIRASAVGLEWAGFHFSFAHRVSE